MIAIAIPAHNEADRIAACLGALARQPDARRHIAGVVVYANNCSDDTAAIARAVPMPVELHIIEETLPPERANIGWARRRATEAAQALLDRRSVTDAVIANTDADSRVAAGWLQAMVDAFAAGADAVAGAIDIDPDDGSDTAAARAAETDYAASIARINAWLDPIDHDPWPNHVWAWGANLAVRSDMLDGIGGVPLVDLAEDRALHQALLRRDAKVRHSLDARVWTSGRSDGRAPGGFADLLASYSSDPDALADFWLEPATVAWRRARWRGAARRLWQRHGHGALQAIASRLDATTQDSGFFGSDWAMIADTAPSLAPRRVAVKHLPAERRRLDRYLARVSRSGAADRSDIEASPGAKAAPPNPAPRP